MVRPARAAQCRFETHSAGGGQSHVGRGEGVANATTNRPTDHKPQTTDYLQTTDKKMDGGTHGEEREAERGLSASVQGGRGGRWVGE